MIPIARLFTRLCVGVSVLVAVAGAVPARAQETRTVTQWMSIADQLIAQKKPADAIAIFGEVSAQHPNFQAARDGLQRSFAAFGSVARNEAFLRYALAKDPGRESALLSAWQVLDQTHPLRFSASSSILPSSNVEHVASQRFFVTDFGTFLINDGGQETSGVGLGYEAKLDWIIHPQPAYRFVLRAAYAGAWYDIARLRYREPSFTLRYEHLGGRSPWSFEGFVRDRSYGGTAQDVTSDNLARGVNFYKAWRPGHGTLFLLQVGGQYQAYSEKPYLSGPRYNLDLERSAPLGRKGRWSLALHLERARPRTDYHRYTGAAVRIGYERALFDGIRGGISLGAGEQRYDALFPILGVKRRDRTLSLGLSAQLDRIQVFGQVPKLSCTARKTTSNVALYTTNSVDCAVSLKFAF